jgi:hypothetical protein
VEIGLRQRPAADAELLFQESSGARVVAGALPRNAAIVMNRLFILCARNVLLWVRLVVSNRKVTNVVQSKSWPKFIPTARALSLA